MYEQKNTDRGQHPEDRATAIVFSARLRGLSWYSLQICVRVRTCASGCNRQAYVNGCALDA